MSPFTPGGIIVREFYSAEDLGFLDRICGIIERLEDVHQRTLARSALVIKLGCNETAPSFAEITSPSSRLFPTPIETKRGRNLPNRRQNRAILWLYPGPTLSGT
jgi:hypothetical protein